MDSFVPLLWVDKSIRGIAKGPGWLCFEATGKATDIQAEVLEGHGLLIHGFAIPLVQDPGICGAEIYDVSKEP